MIAFLLLLILDFGVKCLHNGDSS